MKLVRIFTVILLAFGFYAPVLVADENPEFIEVNWWDHFGLGFKYSLEDYTDLEITDRSVPENDLGLIFNYPDVDSQNSAERLRWKETNEIIDLHWANEIGIGKIDLFIGFGSVQLESNFNNDSVTLSGDVFEAGLNLKFNAGRKWQAAFELSYAAGEAENSTLNQVDLAGEKLAYEWDKLTLSLTASKKYKYYDWVLRPHAGIMYSALNADEEYTAYHLVNTTRLAMGMENDPSTQLRATLGVLIEIPGNYPAINTEFAIGSDKTYNVILSIMQFF